jgi:hypothetical protein
LLCFPMSVRRRSLRNLVGTASLVGPNLALRQAACYIDS